MNSCQVPLIHPALSHSQHVPGRVEAGGVFLLLLADAGGRLPGRHQPDYAAVAALRGQRLHLPLEGHRLLPAAVRRHQETVRSADCAYMLG